ncbi:monovalent cation/H(+) antiporter subunit G [uncultured Pseudokineococcus sp.]|uniref:monovalent cation/H(+) antiporter subunit G n=1 Tax=uncultured Pseudokineococcus sp. TaxID=1642928 RepID=UPI0026281F43|nr:monovalent cation/H(+) antiporter subunit G [uncultured Pseudokineococcus sp.]
MSPAEGPLGTVLDVLSAVCLGAGVLLAVVAALGVLRLPDVLTRLHAAAKPQALGVVLVAIGVALAVRTPAAFGVVTLVVVFQLVTAPVAAHMVGRAAYRTGKVRPDLLLLDELGDLAPGEAPEGGMPEAGAASADQDADRPAEPGDARPRT